MGRCGCVAVSTDPLHLVPAIHLCTQTLDPMLFGVTLASHLESRLPGPLACGSLSLGLEQAMPMLDRADLDT